jgi:hypothetical protein
MFDSSLPPVVCSRTHVLFTLFVFVCILWCPTRIMLCLCFVCVHLLYPMLPDSCFVCVHHLYPMLPESCFVCILWCPSHIVLYFCFVFFVLCALCCRCHGYLVVLRLSVLFCNICNMTDKGC